MPPKVKISKEDIISASVEIVRRSGDTALNARIVASELKCSTQPIFSNFSTMDELRLAVVEKADMLCQKYIQCEIDSKKYPDYKASGMAYIRFAKEEKELFKLLYMRDRSGEAIPEESELGDKMESIVKNSTGLDADRTKLFHLEMWAFVHGIATMFATGFLDLEWNLVSKMLTDTYQGLIKQFGKE